MGKLRGLRIAAIVLFSMLPFVLDGQAKDFHLPYCELFQSDEFNGKLIVTKMKVYIPAVKGSSVDGGERFFFSPDCNNRDFFALAATNGTSILPNELSVVSADAKVYAVEVKGRFSIGVRASYGHLESFRATFDVISAKLTSELEITTPLPDWVAYAPIIETGNSVRELNRELMFDLFGDGKKVDIDGYCSSPSIYFQGKPITKERLAVIFGSDSRRELRLQVRQMTVKGSIWRIQGLVSSHREGEIARKIRYDNSFRANDADTILIAVRLKR